MRGVGLMAVRRGSKEGRAGSCLPLGRSSEVTAPGSCNATFVCPGDEPPAATQSHKNKFIPRCLPTR